MTNNRHQGLCLSISIIAAYTLPLRLSKPNTGTLPAAPRPRLPLRLPPK